LFFPHFLRHSYRVNLSPRLFVENMTFFSRSLFLGRPCRGPPDDEASEFIFRRPSRAFASLFLVPLSPSTPAICCSSLFPPPFLFDFHCPRDLFFLLPGASSLPPLRERWAFFRQLVSIFFSPSFHDTRDFFSFGPPRVLVFTVLQLPLSFSFVRFPLFYSQFALPRYGKIAPA